jgi:triacylglycerol lipase
MAPVRPRCAARALRGWAATLMLLLATLGGCKESGNAPPEPTPKVVPSEPDGQATDAIQPSLQHLQTERLINKWGRSPDIEWKAVVTLGEMCKLAYDDEPTRRRVLGELGFSDPRLLDVFSNSGFIAMADGTAVVAFRGTDDRFDWIANGDFRQLLELDGSRKLHAGFRRAYGTFDEEIRSFLKENKPKRVWITGHSLGGAMAACCAYSLLQEGLPPSGVVTFGQPRIGNEALAEYLDSELGDRYLRLMNEGDPVPILPPCFGKKLPAYWDSGRRVWFFGGQLFTTEGPTLYAQQAPGADDSDHNLDETEGKDEYESVTEDDFLELQRQLRVTPDAAVQAAEVPGAYSASPEATSSAMFDGILGFFYARIDEHAMDAYLKQLRARMALSL